VSNVQPRNILLSFRSGLPRPTWGEADARLRAAGEGPKLLKIPDVRRTRQPRHTKVPHPNPLPTWGEGIGRRAELWTRFFILSLLALTTSCSQVHEKMFTLNCAIGRRPLPGELAPNTAMALDVSTSPIPLLFPAHRAIARCDNSGVVTFDIETPVETGISQLSTPISTAASHITYAP
jgi:hypothetical protein